MRSQKSNNLFLLALTGFSAGILTSVLSSLLVFVSREFVFLSDTVFGAAVSWYFWRFRGVRSGWRLLAFVVASILAYQAASAASMFTPAPRDILGFPSGSLDQIPSDRFFIGGFVGSVILFAAGFFFLSTRTHLKGFAAIAFIFSVLSGALGIFGWSLGNTLGLVLWKVLGSIHLVRAYSANMAGSQNGHFYSLFVVWQTGMAVLLGIALPDQSTLVSDRE